MPTVKQPSANPTNKLSAATAGAGFVAVLGLVLKNLAPDWYDPEALMTLTPLVVFAFGYIIKDQPNV